MRLAKTFLLITLFLNVIIYSVAQIQYEEFPGGSTKVFIFENGKKFNITDNNPFILDRQPDSQDGNVYKYRKVDRAEKNVSEMLSQVGWRAGYTPEKDMHYNFILLPTLSEVKKFVAVSYLLLAYTDYSELIGQASYIKVLDSTGKIVFEKQFPFDCLSPSITNDGKILIFRTGGKHDESLIPIEKNQVIFLDMMKDSVLLKVPPADSTYIIWAGVENNNFIVNMNNMNKHVHEYHIYKPESSMLYRLKLDYMQSRNIIEFTSDGLILGKEVNDTIVTEKLLFERDFIKEKMK